MQFSCPISIRSEGSRVQHSDALEIEENLHTLIEGREILSPSEIFLKLYNIFSTVYFSLLASLRDFCALASSPWVDTRIIGSTKIQTHYFQ